MSAAAPEHIPVLVLIADDSCAFREFLRLQLHKEFPDWRFAETTSVQETIDACLALRPDLVLLDVYFPEGNSIQAVPRINQALPDTPVILLSAFDSHAAREAATRAGAMNFVSKPRIFEDLMGLLRDLPLPPRRAVTPSPIAPDIVAGADPI